MLASFALTLLAPSSNWPKALLHLSPFDQYGMRLVDGLQTDYRRLPLVPDRSYASLPPMIV
jgi:hypothetical protein